MFTVGVLHSVLFQDFQETRLPFEPPCVTVRSYNIGKKIDIQRWYMCFLQYRMILKDLK